jgi:hypothetical protein
MSKNTTVECLNENCEKEFITTKSKSVDEIVICTHCGTKHELDSDYGDDDNPFWYLNRTITQK